MAEWRALTLHQPYATGIAEGFKTIETRNKPVKYRGWLAIHAASKMPPGMDGPAGMIGQCSVDRDGPGHDWYMLDRDWPGWLHGANQYPIDLPLGAVVAVARLVDVVPIVEREGENESAAEPRPSEVWVSDDPLALATWDHGWDYEEIESERPWGDFTPGRYAYLLDDVRKLDRPIPAKGKQGLWKPDDELRAQLDLVAA